MHKVLYEPGPGTDCFLATSSGSIKIKRLNLPCKFLILDLIVNFNASVPILIFLNVYAPGPGSYF